MKVAWFCVFVWTEGSSTMLLSWAWIKPPLGSAVEMNLGLVLFCFKCYYLRMLGNEVMSLWGSSSARHESCPPE